MATLSDLLRAGYKPPTESALGDPIVEHFRTLPQQIETNQRAMDKTMGGMYQTDFLGKPNPNYYPEAMQEFTQNYAPNVMGSTTAVRMAKAMKNAMLPIEQGGLGLPAGNTAAQRAKALGYTEEAYHGSDKAFEQFNPALADTRRKTGTPVGAVVVSSNPKTASTYTASPDFRGGEWITNYAEGGNVMPLLIKKDKNLSMNAASGSPDYTPYWNDIFDPKYPDIQTTNEFAKLAKEKGKKTATIKNVKDNALPSGAEGDTTFIFDPSLIRSKFAAFDPKRRHEADILAAAMAIPMGDEENRKELLERLFNQQK